MMKCICNKLLHSKFCRKKTKYLATQSLVRQIIMTSINPGLVIPSEQQNLEKGGILLGILTLNIAEEKKYMLLSK